MSIAENSKAIGRLNFEPSISGHRTPRSWRRARIAPAASLTTARASLNLMSSSPSCQDSVSVDVLNVRAVLPVVASKFSAIAVRVDRWRGAAGRGALNSVLSVFMGVDCPSFDESTRVNFFVGS